MLLGGFELWSNDRLVEIPPGGQRLVALLAIRGRFTHRAYVVGTLWPEASEAHATANLRSLLWRLNRLDTTLIERTRSSLRLRTAIVVDVRELMTLADRLAASTGADDADVDAVIRSGDLLPGWYDDWVLVERERLRQARLFVLEGLCERFIAAGRFGLAVEVALAALANEPLRESAQLLMIRAEMASGNRVEAIRRFSAYRQLLREELDLEPSGEIVALIRSLH